MPSEFNPATDDECDNADSVLSGEEFLRTLTPHTRQSLLKPASLAPPAPPDTERQILDRLEQIIDRLSVLPPVSTGQIEKLPGLMKAIEEAGLTGAEREIVIEVARSGKARIIDLEAKCECDVLSAHKRAKKKLRKVGWVLDRQDNHICVKPLPAPRK